MYGLELLRKREGTSIVRHTSLVPPKREGPRVNEHIAVDSVRLIDGAGEQVGVVNIDRALDMAAESGLDLVEISPGAEPPVCKLMDYGKYKYEAQKKAAAMAFG